MLYSGFLGRAIRRLAKTYGYHYMRKSSLEENYFKYMFPPRKSYTYLIEYQTKKEWQFKPYANLLGRHIN